MKSVPIEEKINTGRLAGFTGSSQFFQHWLSRAYIYTEGVQYLDANGAGWLIDAVFSHQTNRKVRACDFQVWKLDVNEDSTCVLTCEDDNGNVLVKQEIEYTDFPMRSFKLWCLHNELNGLTLMLPSEY